MGASTIPLAGVAPQINSPAQNLSAINQYQNILSQQMLRQQEMERYRLENQQRAQDIADQQTMKQALIDSKGDTDAFMTAINGKVSPKTEFALQEQMLKAKQTMATMTELQQKNLKEQNDAAVGLADGVLGATDDQKQSTYATARGAAIARKLPQAEQLPEQYPGDDTLKTWRNLHMMGTQSLESSQKLQEITKNALANAAQTVDSAVDEPSYQQWRNAQDWHIRNQLPANYSPAAVAQVKTLGMTPKEQIEAPGQIADAAAKQRANDAAILAIAAKRGPDALKSALGRMPYDRAKVFEGLTDPADIRAAGQTAEQQQTSAQAAESEATRNRQADTAERRADQADQRLALTAERIAKAGEPKPATRAQFANVEAKKASALQASKKELDKELAAATSAGGRDEQAIETAWNDHIGRVQDAQRAYEAEVSSLTGEEVPHNYWADNLKPPAPATPAKGGKAAPVAGPASSPTTPQAQPAATSAPAAKPAQAPPIKEVGIKLPNGKVKYFPNQQALEDFAKEAGLTLSQSK